MALTAQAVSDLAAQPRFVGAQVGILMVLHTWSGPLHHHPHVHLLVTGGGVTADGSRWHQASSRFLVPVKLLSRMIRQRFAAALRQHHPELYAQVPPSAWTQAWCTWCQPFGAGAPAVLSYLGRYVFRIALTNRRLLHMDDTHVTFQYKVRATGAWRRERLPGVDFLARFLLHVLPKGFHKVRYHGLWHPSRRPLHTAIRLLLPPTPPHGDVDPARPSTDPAAGGLAPAPGARPARCPACGSTLLRQLQQTRRGSPVMVT